jgi:hypothetical protein
MLPTTIALFIFSNSLGHRLNRNFSDHQKPVDDIDFDVIDISGY